MASLATRLPCVFTIAVALSLAAAAGAWGDTTPTLADSQPATPPAHVGDQLSLTAGTYDNDTSGSDIVDTWYACAAPAPTTPKNCTYLQQTSPTPTSSGAYTVESDDQGKSIVVFEADAPATAGLVESTVIPVQSAPAGPSPPTQVTGPTIVGVPVSGTTLTANNGSWVGASSFSDDWSRCLSDGSGCKPVSTGPTYLLTSDDVGAQILLNVTAADGLSTAPGDPALFGPIKTSTNQVTKPSAGGARPAIVGTPQLGSKLKGLQVPMSYNAALSYQWMRCASGCTPIGGATDMIYTPGAADVGHKLAFSETGTNTGGSTTVQSVQSAMVTAPTQTTLQVTPRSIVAGQPVTLIATVTSATGAAPPRGSITFAQSGTPVKGCTGLATQPSGASATIVCRTRFGATPSGLTAVFTPATGALVTGSSSSAGGFVVGRDATSIKLKVPRSVTLGHGARFVAAVHTAPGTKGITPTGTIVFLDGKQAIGGCTTSLTSRGRATCSVTYRRLGSHSISAEYLGDAAFSGAQSHLHALKVSVAKPKGFVSALMAWTFHYSPRWTTVATLRVTGLVRGVAVALGCSGHGCPLHHHVWHMGSARCSGRRGSCKALNLAKALHGHRLGVGAQLTVRITHRNWLGKYYRFVVRPGRKPRIATSCLAVGGSRPGIACTPR